MEAQMRRNGELLIKHYYTLIHGSVIWLWHLKLPMANSEHSTDWQGHYTARGLEFCNRLVAAGSGHEDAHQLLDVNESILI
jgi:hypothetical protein